MPDLARFLPLSQRTPGDEAEVTSDRRTPIAAVVALAADALAAASAEEVALFVERAELTPVSSTPSVAGLRDLVRSIPSGPRRRNRDLAAVVRAYLLLPADTRAPLPTDIAGAVALYASTTASHDRRAAIAGHTVRASDGDWSFGRGTEITAPGDAIVAFLLGVSDTPPRRPVS